MKLNLFGLSSSLYCAVKILCLRYKNQSVNVVQIKVIVCLGLPMKHKCTLGRTFHFLLTLVADKVTARL